MLISLHLPKTAGESFFYSLKDHFGGKVLRDYDDKPINTPVLKRNARALRDCLVNSRRKAIQDYECIHGHFLPVKYRLLKDAVFVTWMRDPVERLASHYYWWKRGYDLSTALPLRKRVVEEEWTLEQFCLSYELRNFYGQFLWKFPLRKFAFIGITEHYESDFRYFSEHFLGSGSFQAYRKKLNPGREHDQYIRDPAFRKRVELFHQRDMQMYHEALKIRSEREAITSGGTIPVH